VVTQEKRRRSSAPSGEYARALERLFALRRFGMRPGLEVIRALVEELGHPERSFPSVHVAGSKGKGSVAAIVASVLAETAGPTGLYTSPHLQSYRERFRIDGRPVSARQVVEGLARVEEASERAAGRLPHAPTFFEVTTALGFDLFARHPVRSAAVEVGLGGEFDATNVLAAPVDVITTIELEHTDVLGPTLSHVARAKAGILHPGARAVVGEPKPEPLAEIERVAGHRGVALWHYGREIRAEDREIGPRGQKLRVVTPHAEHPGLEVPLLGAFQVRNVALAVAALDLYAEATGRPIPETALRAGLRRVRWRGRLERVARRPDLYLDVAHTPESAQAVAASLAEIQPFIDPEENALLFAALKGKRFEAMFEPLSTLARTIVLVPLRTDRSAPVGELKHAAVGHFPRLIVAPSVEAGLPLARAATGPEGFTLAIGSDYLAGELLDLLEGRPSGEPDLADPSGISSPPLEAKVRGT
jgi:dihydrofolate synthase/folylpolyglutamate synthase